MLIGTSLTFHRGAAFNDELVDQIARRPAFRPEQ